MANENSTGRDYDALKLLHECDAGIKMGISSIDDVIENIKNQNLKSILINSKEQHQKLKLNQN